MMSTTKKTNRRKYMNWTK